MPARPEPRTLHPEAVIILVTASWCLPCRPARTLLQELQRRWGERVLTLVLDVDRLQESASTGSGPSFDSDAAEDEGTREESSPSAGTQVLDRLSVEHLPTWIILHPGDWDESEGQSPFAALQSEDDCVEDAGEDFLLGETLDGSRVMIGGAWNETARRIGAASKLEILALVGERA